MSRAFKFLCLLLIITTLSIGCNSKKESQKFEFHYFPEKNVYYDVSNESFFYSLDGAKTWKSFKGNVNGDATSLGEMVVIDTEDSLVYNKNEEHRRMYAGRVLNINFQNATSSPAVAEVAERKVVVRKKPQGKAKGQGKEKKGIGKFFDKIFGKS